MEKTFSIGESYSQAWHLLSENILLVVLFFISIVPSFFTNSDTFSESLISGGGTLNAFNAEKVLDAISGSMIGLSIAMTVLELILQVGFYNGVVTVAKGGKASFNAYKLPVGTYFKVFFGILCTSIIECIGLCFCLLPGLYLGVKLMFVPLIMIDDPECGFTEAFQRSWDMTRGNFWQLFGLMITNLVVVLIGVICCCIGIVAALPLAVLATAVIYMTLKPEEETITVEEA